VSCSNNARSILRFRKILCVINIFAAIYAADEIRDCCNLGMSFSKWVSRACLRMLWSARRNLNRDILLDTQMKFVYLQPY